MRQPSLEVLRYGEVLGYAYNVVKTVSKSIIISHKGDYYTISAAWRKGDSGMAVYRLSQKITFDTSEQTEEWWYAYQLVVERAITQIYI